MIYIVCSVDRTKSSCRNNTKSLSLSFSHCMLLRRLRFVIVSIIVITISYTIATKRQEQQARQCLVGCAWIVTQSRARSLRGVFDRAALETISEADRSALE